MAATKYQYGSFAFPSSISRELFMPRTRRTTWGVKVYKAKLSESDAKSANLTASKRERIKLPNHDGANVGNKFYHISEFLRHPSGIEAILNTRALQRFESVDTNVYRCTLPPIQLLSFEVAPVLELKVITSSDNCMVEMLSCRFEGSELVERQNEHFSASMTNYITWETIDAEPFLDVDVKLNLVLEIFSQPFLMLPTSAVERPGNVMMQALVDRLVPLLVQQLLRAYEEWVLQQCRCLPSP